MATKQFIKLLPERKDEFLQKALQNDLICQKLVEAKITHFQLMTNPKHFHHRTPTNTNRKKLFGTVGEWIGMHPGKGVSAKWTILNDCIFIMAFQTTDAVNKLRAKDGNQKEAIEKGGMKYRELFKYYTGYDSGRTNSSLQNAGLPYAVIAKQVRQEVDITEQTTQLQEAENKISDFEDRMTEIELEQQSLVQKNAKLEDEKKQLQAAKETEVNRQGALIQNLTDRMDTMEESMENTKKRCFEAEAAANFYRDKYQKMESINNVCAQHDVAQMMALKTKIDAIRAMPGGDDYFETMKTIGMTSEGGSSLLLLGNSS